MTCRNRLYDVVWVKKQKSLNRSLSSSQVETKAGKWEASQTAVLRFVALSSVTVKLSSRHSERGYQTTTFINSARVPAPPQPTAATHSTRPHRLVLHRSGKLLAAGGDSPCCYSSVIPKIQPQFHKQPNLLLPFSKAWRRQGQTGQSKQERHRYFLPWV